MVVNKGGGTVVKNNTKKREGRHGPTNWRSRFFFLKPSKCFWEFPVEWGEEKPNKRVNIQKIKDGMQTPASDKVYGVKSHHPQSPLTTSSLQSAAGGAALPDLSSQPTNFTRKIPLYQPSSGQPPAGNASALPVPPMYWQRYYTPPGGLPSHLQQQPNMLQPTPGLSAPWNPFLPFGPSLLQPSVTNCKQWDPQDRLKSDKCSMAWSLESTKQELDRLKMELHQKLDTEADQLRKVSQNYENDKKLWAAAMSDLESKIKAMKQEQALLSLQAHKFAQDLPDSSKMIEAAVRALVAQYEGLKVKYHEEMAQRKKLHNIVQDLKGNIRVFCRCRPLSKDEKSSGLKGVVDFGRANDGDIGIMTGGMGKKVFTFDRVYTPKDDNADVYIDTSPLITSVLNGYNVCIFAYGQTGTGKTFTMEGTEGNRGVNYRALEELFKIAEERKDDGSHDIYVCLLEVYNEQIRDLLATSSSSKNLEIKQAGEGSHHLPGIVEAKVQNISQVWDILQTGSSARAVESNYVNKHSSRSHCMLCIKVTAKKLINGDCTRSKLCLVDLAGTERLNKTHAEGDRLKEAVNINRSLSALGDVFNALATGSKHIPYRRSKLTELLQDFLGGDSKALMIVQISPSENDSSETLSSLKFASRVRGIELGPAKKQVDKGKPMLESSMQWSKQKAKLKENCKNLENKAKGKEQMVAWELEVKLQQRHRLDAEIAALYQLLELEVEVKLKEQEQEQQRSAAESKEKQEEPAGRRGEVEEGVDPSAAVDLNERKRCRVIGGSSSKGGMASRNKTQGWPGPGRQTVTGLRL